MSVYKKNYTTLFTAVFLIINEDLKQLKHPLEEWVKMFIKLNTTQP